MALVFTVCAPTKAFTEPFATQVANTLRSHFGDTIDLNSEEDMYSEELGWSGWAKLQDRGMKACGLEQLPHFLSMEAWRGCYLPVETECGTFQFTDASLQLNVGALVNLIAELEMIGRASDLPVDDIGLKDLFEKYMEDEDLIDEDMDIQAYTQLLPLARYARKQRLPLWVVK